MTIRSVIMKVSRQDGLNFLLTNRIPRRALTSFMGWFSRIEQPLVRDVSLAVWRLFTDLDLSEAERTDFRSIRDCFTRTLKPGARPFAGDPDILASPCDAIVGAAGVVTDGQALQVKGRTYPLAELLGGAAEAEALNGACYVTLRLTSAMYHRFHAPHDCDVESVSYIPGDVWNVNPPALARVDRLFCRNERAVVRTRLRATGHGVTLVPVAAILVAGIRLPFLSEPLRSRSPDRRNFVCDSFRAKGGEMGWFEHGSTIIVFAQGGFTLMEGIRTGVTIRAGQSLMHLPGFDHNFDRNARHSSGNRDNRGEV